MINLQLHIEAIIFAAEQSVSLEEISGVLTDTFGLAFPEAEILAAIEAIGQKYGQDDFAFELTEISGGYRFMTKGAYHLTLSHYLKTINQKKLSKAAIETLSIIAYKQPVSKTEIESIRGVNCDYVVQKLLEKDLVEIAGRADGPGKPLLYRTSAKFMDYFGLKSIKDLPSLKEFQPNENEIGEPIS